MSIHRSRTAALVLTVAILSSACSNDDDAPPTPVTGHDRPTTTGSASSTATNTSSSEATTSAPAPSPVPSPPVTKPLTTAPPSALLDEVVAAYDAAYADLLAAEAVMDENHPALAHHIAGLQLERWREVIRGARVDGLTARPRQGGTSWRRVERFEQSSSHEVRLEVCSYDTTETVDASGVVVSRADRPFRFLETMTQDEGGWKWTAREWIDASQGFSDCALPS